jgi:hypothetical protein
VAYELAYVKLFQVLKKYLPYSFIVYDPSKQAQSLLQWGIPEDTQKRLCNSIKNIHFEYRVVNKPILNVY